MPSAIASSARAAPPLARIELAGQLVAYRLTRSRTAQRLRVRVSTRGVEVVQPTDRATGDVAEFLQANAAWVLAQVARVSRFEALRRPVSGAPATMLYLGQPTPVRVEERSDWHGPNRVQYQPGSGFVVVRGPGSRVDAATTLEMWLRRQARQAVNLHLASTLPLVRRTPASVSVRGQRTRWGSCSARGNLSFNWRLIQAPDFVLHYLVVHEAVHLAVPDHSRKFWLTVKSLCVETERARQWLCAHGPALMQPLVVG